MYLGDLLHIPDFIHLRIPSKPSPKVCLKNDCLSNVIWVFLTNLKAGVNFQYNIHETLDIHVRLGWLAMHLDKNKELQTVCTVETESRGTPSCFPKYEHGDYTLCDKYQCCIHFMDGWVFQYSDKSVFWYLTTVGYVDILPGLLFDHVAEGPDRYWELLKQTTVPVDLCAQFFSFHKEGNEKTPVMLQAFKLTLIETL